MANIGPEKRVLARTLAFANLSDEHVVCIWKSIFKMSEAKRVRVAGGAAERK